MRVWGIRLTMIVAIGALLLFWGTPAGIRADLDSWQTSTTFVPVLALYGPRVKPAALRLQLTQDGYSFAARGNKFFKCSVGADLHNGIQFALGQEMLKKYFSEL